MNRIVREHFPVADLPEALRQGLDQGEYVRVTLEQEPAPQRADSVMVRRARLAQLFTEARPSFDGLGEIAAHIESIRAEWD